MPDAGATIDAVSCRAKGFTDGLECVSCKSLIDFNLSELEDDCKACCVGDDTDVQELKRYPSARLEVCNWKLQAFPQIEPFVKGDKQDRFANLETRHKKGQPPRLLMLNDLGEVEEELNVESWNTDSVEEFLSARLVQ